MTITGEQPATTALHELLAAITSAIRHDEGVQSAVRSLLVAAGRLRSALDILTIYVQTVDRLANTLGDLALSILPDIIRGHDEHLSDIRRFFLEPQETYTVEELAKLWLIPIDNVLEIYRDKFIEQAEDNDLTSDESSFNISWADAIDASRTFNLLRPLDIDLAVGDEHDRVQSEKWHAIPIVIWLPQFIAESLSDARLTGNSRTLAVRVEQLIVELHSTEYHSEYWRE